MGIPIAPSYKNTNSFIEVQRCFGATSACSIKLQHNLESDKSPVTPYRSLRGGIELGAKAPRSTYDLLHGTHGNKTSPFSITSIPPGPHPIPLDHHHRGRLSHAWPLPPPQNPSAPPSSPTLVLLELPSVLMVPPSCPAYKVFGGLPRWRDGEMVVQLFMQEQPTTTAGRQQQLLMLTNLLCLRQHILDIPRCGSSRVGKVPNKDHRRKADT
jgi:hypothetical protein